jgi:hypothetical protein
MGMFLLILSGWAVVPLVRYHVLTGKCYDHVEELIKADQHAGRRRMRAGRLRLPGTSQPSGGLYQPTAIAPASPHRHVWLLPGVLFAIWPARGALRGVIVHWSPLVRYPDAEWCADLADRVAHFLAVDSNLVRQADMNLRRRRLTITRA